ncbi:MAG: hypothetical protein ACYSSP_01300 [Planctomycetota bacterium]|jgi:hypothetical protein
MIKTLHITSIIFGILAVGLIVFGIGIGGHGDEEIEKFLQSPNAIKKFKTDKGKTSPQARSQASPLVKEAKTFALYLNPPPKPAPKKKPASKSKTQKKTKNKRPSTPVTAKFKLVGTAYYPLNPKTSMALIDQPGKGLSWVRQGTTVQHLTFEQIKDGVVIIRDGKDTREMKTPARPEEKVIQKFTASSSNGPKKAGSKKGASTRRKNQPNSKANLEDMKMFVEFFSKLDTITDKETETGKPETQMIDELFSSLSKTRMDDKETNKLRELGETLEQTRELASDEPNLESELVPNLETNLDLNVEPNSESNFDPNLETNLDLVVEQNSEPNFDPNSGKIQRSTRSRSRQR